MEGKELFLLDGHALVYRAHYAFITRPLINSKGINTSAITGFVRTLWDLITNQKPSHLAVAFDPKGDTFRHKDYPEYKANRDAQPEDISIAFPYIEAIVKAFNIPIICIDNYEADDVIGTLAKQAEKEGFRVYMVTPDKDYGQLVSENIFMYKPSRQGNGVDIWGVKEIKIEWDIARPEQVIDILALQGDSVDNIPGIPGIGAKTAAKLLHEYDTLENILANSDQLKGKQKENVQNFAEQGRMSKYLATIDINVPIKFDEEAYRIENFDRAKLKDLFKELEFRSLAVSILGETQADLGVQASLFQLPSESYKEEEKKYSLGKKDINTVKKNYILCQTEEEMQTLADILLRQTIFCFDTETTGLDVHSEEIVGIAFSWKRDEGYYVPLDKDQSKARKQLDIFKQALESPSIVKVGQNLKFDINMLYWYGIEVKGKFFDTMIAHYLMEPDLRHKLDYLSESYLNYHMVSIEELIGKRGPKQKTMRSVHIDELVNYAAEDADITLQLKEEFAPKLDKEELTSLFDSVEMPLIPVLSRMECEGIRVNKEFLLAYSSELTNLILDVEKKIFDQAGTHFNISSPKQVGEILFDHLKIPYRWSKIKTKQYSTDVDKLTELAEENQIVIDILEYRMYAKLKSTYVDALPQMINDKTGRIHTSYNQARAATGRLSSENPNLQNIPIKNEAGREIRKAFIPRDENYVLLAADYSQIELRLIAEISNDEAMLAAFISGEDIHRATAAGVYEVSLEDVTAEQRRNAKTVNFSIIYGAGATNLSRQLRIKRTEASELIEQYFKRYLGLKSYMEDTVEFARKHGYVTTLIGRKRYIRDIDSRNGLARSNAERISINTPIQGTAADMIKIAMIKIDQQMRSNQMKSKMLLQVHDELVFDAHKDELELLKSIVDINMRDAIPNLKVPIIIEMGVGDNWLEAH